MTKKSKAKPIQNLTETNSLSSFSLDNFSAEDVLRNLEEMTKIIKIQEEMEDDCRFDEELEIKTTKTNFGHLRSIIHEYFTGFLLIGYDMNGERVIIDGSTSPMMKDAITEFYNKLGNSGMDIDDYED